VPRLFRVVEAAVRGALVHTPAAPLYPATTPLAADLRPRPTSAAVRADEMASLPVPAVPVLDPVPAPRPALLTPPLAWLLAAALPDLRRHAQDAAEPAPWKHLFAAGTHGYSLRAFERRVWDYPGGVDRPSDGVCARVCVSSSVCLCVCVYV
jgi:hypothetical protein